MANDQIVVDLVDGSITQINGGIHPNIIQLGTFVGPVGAKQAVFKININPNRPYGYKQLSVVVEYQGTPSGWTAHIADSPTCDGYGGDAGTTTKNAEMQILNQQMSVFSADIATSPVTVDQILIQDLALTDSAIKFVVKNQFLSWGQPHGSLQTPNSKLLFAIPDISTPEPHPDGYWVYVGLNRVVHVLPPGAPSQGRIGTGAVRAIITLQ